MKKNRGQRFNYRNTIYTFLIFSAVSHSFSKTLSLEEGEGGSGERIRK